MYSPTISANRCQATMLCHSVRSCHSPALSLNRSLVARLNLAKAGPPGVYFTSGSLPRFPTKMTLLTLFAILLLLVWASAFRFRRRIYPEEPSNRCTPPAFCLRSVAGSSLGHFRLLAYCSPQIKHAPSRDLAAGLAEQ